MYDEALRPQYHFTAPTGWLNDPNGLVYHDGEYHLFYQHNPHDVAWGNMTWGHAVSSDLLHWEHLPHALEPDEMGTMFSGTAVIDGDDTAGFGAGAMVVFYTAEGSCVEPKAPSTQCLAYSVDGRRFVKYAGNPILPEITPGNRDPKVFWHEPTSRWIMVLYVGRAGNHYFQFFVSADLKDWEFLSEIDGFYECPDLFELDGQWVLFAADGQYVLGDFDGTRFTPTTGKSVGDWGANFYAAQTWSDIPESDGRRIIIGWMRGGKHPDMPFSQQMTIPCELTLRDGALCKWPVRELETLRGSSLDGPVLEGDCFDIEVEVEPGETLDWGFDIRGLSLRYLTDAQVLVVDRHAAPLLMRDGRVHLRILVDRSSVEVFADHGRVVFSQSFCPPPENRRIVFVSSGGEARIHNWRAYALLGLWSRQTRAQSVPDEWPQLA